MVKDYYKILGLERTSSAKDIKLAYLKLLKKYHPDLYPENVKYDKKYQEIVEAYKVLGNLDNRLRYSIQLNKKISLPKIKDEDD